MSDAGRFDYEIAVVGMAGRFPGARSTEEFWRNLCAGVESISFFTDEELAATGVDAQTLSDPNYVKAEGYLADADLFDAAFFGFTPREAEMMDPQHRLFLETAWQALEHAGYNSEAYDGRIGVYAGESINSYLIRNVYPNRALVESAGAFQTIIGNDRDYLATQVSYKLNLKGAALSVQTACSTSLVAVHLACQSLLNRECDMALAGGVSVSVPQKEGAFYQEGGIISPDGHCRAFDARARGTVKGSGVGVVLLKRLSDALADGDTIDAVIKGSAMNNDGSVKVGFTAPSVEGQASVIEEALAMAEVEPESIGYIEAHGTGTPLGDPIEIAALTQAFRTGTEAKNFCRIGSVKTNVGHLDAAAGVTGLIKTVLALKHRQIPPSLHFESPNPQIDFANSPFYVNAQLADWDAQGETPRRAGVSSFGIGGTNVHVVLEEAPAAQAPGNETSDIEASGVEASGKAAREFELLTLSARTEAALDVATANLAAYLKEHADANLDDAAYTLHVGRKGFAHRRAIVCRTAAEAASALETLDAKRVHTAAAGQAKRAVVFMFSGQGTQYTGMARGLYEGEPVFREQVDRCAELLKSHLGLDLRDVLYPSDERVAEATAQLTETRLAQPALFVVEYALAKLWMSWGVEPSAVVGHSIGEYAAACLAGVFTLEDALRLVAARGRLMQEMPPGSMLAVPLTEEQAREYVGARISLAAVNAPGQCVLSGETEAIEELERRLTERGLACRRLHTSHALHSALMEPMLEPFLAELKRAKLHAPQLPYISSVSGAWAGAELTDAQYWTRQIRQPVRFGACVAEALAEPERVLLEVGPGQTLVSLAKRHSDEAATKRIILSSVHHPQEQQPDAAFLLSTLGRLWASGVEVDWQKFHAGETRRRVPLPTYPFERRRYWVEPPAEAAGAQAADKLDKKPDMSEWFYVPSWKRSVVPERGAKKLAEQECWLVFTDECGLGAHVVEGLERDGETVFTVQAGEAFDRLDESAFTVKPGERAGYDALLKELRTLRRTPARILHLWGVTPEREADGETGAAAAAAMDETAERTLQDAQERGFYSLIFLAQALGEHGLTEDARVVVVTNGLQDVTGEERLAPEKATVLGSCRVIAQEYPLVDCRSVDVALPPQGAAQEARLARQIVAELASASSDATVAYRGGHRWVQTYEPLRMDGGAGVETRDADTEAHGAERLREGGVYLLTGGLGEFDLALAENLYETLRARLILTGQTGDAPGERAPFPSRDEWERWLSTHDDEDETSRRVRRVLALEASGAEVLVSGGDVASEAQMRSLVAEARARFGRIDGVFHTAAVSGGGLVQLKTPEMAAAVLAPKVRGTRVLRSVLDDAPPSFFVLFSTSLALTGVFGQVDYCAANSYLDAFARAQALNAATTAAAQDATNASSNDASTDAPFTVSIDWHIPQWETWQELSLAGVPEVQAQFAQQRAAFGVAVAEGIEAIKRILAREHPQVVVSTQDFAALMREQEAAGGGAGLLAQLQGVRPAEGGQARVASGDYAAPTNETEEAVAALWEELFGMQRVGANDNFFDLGGNSLLAIQLVSQLRKTFEVELPLSRLFESPTVSGLADAIGEVRVKEQEAEEIARMLQEIEALSLEELQANLAQEAETTKESSLDG